MIELKGWLVKGKNDIIFFEKKPVKRGGEEWFSKTGGYIDLTSQLKSASVPETPVRCSISININ
jgi:hypothetical protein